MSRIAKAIGATKDVLEENYPSANIKSAESGECDFRVSSVGASISVRPYGSYDVTEADREDIIERVESEINDRNLVLKGETNSGAYMFDLKS